jgi:hypothetical protein
VAVFIIKAKQESLELENNAITRGILILHFMQGTDVLAQRFRF